ncbi:uncharacterized protein LOC130054902 isoform X1 [Ostrea edulis]|uniref:uncharacterized protein LOC130054902 isoform X1 n=1 Tax=Ostrea edulis TaxID=37623 RepID=UPI0024AF43DC|nr:uncharacterized protein LOC130054902 isoform X1 [Ostrea edulis]
MRYTLAVLVTLWVVGINAVYEVPVQKGRIWGRQKERKMKGWCEFELNEYRDTGEIKMDLIFDKSTRNLKIWLMNIEKTLNNGRFYELSNKHPYQNMLLKVEFILSYTGGQKNYPKGKCISNITPPSPTTLKPSTQAPVTQSSNTPQSSVATPTQQPSTAAPSQQPSTEAAKLQPATLAPTQQPSTATLIQQPAYQASRTDAPMNTTHDYGFILHQSILFYEAQQAGNLTNNRISWRKNATTLDRGINGEDLTGGWYDAGDIVNFNLPMAGSTTNLALGLLYWKDAYEKPGELDNMYNSIKWPLDYFIKCWNTNKTIYYAQVGNGAQDHSKWRRPENITTPRPVYYLDTNKKGSDVVGETVAAMAAGAIVFKDKDPVYSQRLHSSAESLYGFAKTIKGLYNSDISDADGFYKSSRYQDELCSSATLLYMLTDNTTYLTEAESFYNEYATDNAPWAFDWDDKTALCQVLLYNATQKSVYKSRTETFVKSYMPGGSLPYTKCGLAFRLEWGSLRYSANAAFISLLAAQNGIGDADSYKTWAMSQIHYMVGDNNKNFSYVIGYGSSYPLRPHHSGSSCSPAPAPCNWNTFKSKDPNPNILYGALVGGPDQNDSYVDERDNFKTNEVTCDYNAGFQSAVAGLLHFALNGNLPAAPARKC